MGRPANDLRKLAELHQRSTDETRRTALRAQARKLAARLHVECPAWCGAVKPLITLDVLEARYKVQSGRAAAATRDHARKLAAKNRVLCPSWAAHLGKPRKPQPTARLASAVPPRPEPLPLPEPLLAWRRGANGRGITQHADGSITLTESTAPREWREARFADVAAAAQAVTPAIPWKRRERAATFGGSRRAATG